MEGAPMNQLLEAALQYAARGWRVFPLESVWFRGANDPVCTCWKKDKCTDTGKHPRYDKKLIPNGLKNATTDRAIIEAWWDKWPQANIGIATGLGLTIMDIDGERGRDELLTLVAAHPGDFPTTLGVRTGNGGHLYFLCDGPRSHAKGNLHVRGDGGYVVAPPSIHKSGRYYEWIDLRVPPAAAPEWLRSWFLAGGDGSKSSQQRPSGGLAAKGESGTSLALGAPPAWIATKQTRNGTVSRLVDRDRKSVV